MDIELILEENQASKGKRVANYLIDMVVCYVIFFTIIVVIEIFLMAENPESTFLSELENDDSLGVNLLLTLGYAVYMCLIEVITKGMSIAKYITGTQVYYKDGNAPTLIESLRRNITRIVPFDGLSFLGSYRGWHDRWSDTYVVNKKQYEAALLAEDDIEQLGV